MAELNYFVFELVKIKRDPLLGNTTISTLAVHPMLVVPKSIRYSDASRSAITQLLNGGIRTVGGRVFRTVSMAGTFGHAPRALGLYMADGNMLFQRFYKEVVRLSDAITKEQKDEAIDFLNGTPLLPLLLLDYSEENTLFGVNFYDFWNGISFQCEIKSFDWAREYRNGGASGLISYNMQIQEAGLLLTGGLGQVVLSALMAILGTWTAINSILATYTVANVANGLAALVTPVANEWADTMDAVASRMSSFQALMQGAPIGSTAAATAGITSMFEALDRAQASTEAMLDLTRVQIDSAALFPSGATLPADSDGEGVPPTIRRITLQAALEGTADALAFNQSVGAYYGMSGPDMRTWAGSAQGRQPNLAHNLLHVVTEMDTPDSIERRYGVIWRLILMANNATPSEALSTGRRLLIPVRRSSGSIGLNGVPTFGSHIGTAVWGADLSLDIEVGPDGDLQVVDEEAILLQGMTWILETLSEEAQKATQDYPIETVELWLQDRFKRGILTDPRFTSVAKVAAARDASQAGYAVTVEAVALGNLPIRGGATL